MRDTHRKAGFITNDKTSFAVPELLFRQLIIKFGIYIVSLDHSIANGDLTPVHVALKQNDFLCEKRWNYGENSGPCSGVALTFLNLSVPIVM